MLTDLLDGTLPNLQDILLIQSSILEARDIYQPWRLGKQLLETKDLEVGGAVHAVACSLPPTIRSNSACLHAAWEVLRCCFACVTQSRLSWGCRWCAGTIRCRMMGYLHLAMSAEALLLTLLFVVSCCAALCACALQDQVGLSLVHLLGDTETLAQTQAPHPVTLQELCDQNKVSVRWVASKGSSL